MRPEDAATAVLRSTWDRVLPVNPIEIANKLGLEVYTSTAIGNLSGYYDDDLKKITVNENESRQRRRFSIAHEIGHAVLQHGSSPRDPSVDYSKLHYSLKEQQANAFAAELVMPQEAVQYMVEHTKKTFEEICETFDVSREAMRIRLQKLDHLW